MNAENVDEGEKLWSQFFKLRQNQPTKDVARISIWELSPSRSSTSTTSSIKNRNTLRLEGTQAPRRQRPSLPTAALWRLCQTRSQCRKTSPLYKSKTSSRQRQLGKRKWPCRRTSQPRSQKFWKTSSTFRQKRIKTIYDPWTTSYSSC